MEVCFTTRLSSRGFCSYVVYAYTDSMYVYERKSFLFSFYFPLAIKHLSRGHPSCIKKRKGEKKILSPVWSGWHCLCFSLISTDIAKRPIDLLSITYTGVRATMNAVLAAIRMTSHGRAIISHRLRSRKQLGRKRKNEVHYLMKLLWIYEWASKAYRHKERGLRCLQEAAEKQNQPSMQTF